MPVFNASTFAACLVFWAQSQLLPEAGNFHLVSETTLEARAELPVADSATIAGLPAVHCGKSTTPQNLWRIGCRNGKAGGELIAFSEESSAPSIVLAISERKLLMVASIGLHDRIVIRTLSQGSDGRVFWSEYLWKPRR